MADKLFPIGDGSAGFQRFRDMGDGTYAPVVSASGGAVGSDGITLNLDALAQALSYNSDGTLNYIQVTSGANTYRQTMTYSGGNLTGISGWVKQ